MGMMVFPVCRTPVPAAEPSTTGEFLAAEFPALDRLAEASGIPPLTAFADQRPVPEGFDGPPWELDEALGACGDWFQAATGRAAFTRLARLIRERPDLTRRLESPERVAEELDDVARILAPAAEAGAEFRLELR